LLGRMGAGRRLCAFDPEYCYASKPLQLFWPFIIAMMMEKASEQHSIASASEEPEVVTGPILLKQAVDFYSATPHAAVIKKAENVITKLPGEFRDRMQMGRFHALGPGRLLSDRLEQLDSSHAAQTLAAQPSSA